MEKVLQAKGLKVTPGRLKILEILSLGHTLLSAEEIVGKMSCHGINRATVYRTLSIFIEKAVITRVNVGKGLTRYELSSHHHHIICTDCGTTEGFEKCDIEKVSKNILKKSPLFKSVSQHSLELFGICRSCSKR